MVKATLNKSELELLAHISDPTSQNQTRKRILAQKQGNLEKSARAFGEMLNRRKERANAEVSVEIKTSKRGNKFIVISGGGLLSPQWLNSRAASTMVNVSNEIKGLIPELVSVGGDQE